MNKDKILKNATMAGADLSAFHEPDKKWKNYYIEDEENDLLFLVPSYLFYGVIVLNLSLARNLTFKTGDGAIRDKIFICTSLTDAVNKISGYVGDGGVIAFQNDLPDNMTKRRKK